MMVPSGNLNSLHRFRCLSRTLWPSVYLLINFAGPKIQCVIHLLYHIRLVESATHACCSKILVGNYLAWTMCCELECYLGIGLWPYAIVGVHGNCSYTHKYTHSHSC